MASWVHPICEIKVRLSSFLCLFQARMSTRGIMFLGVLCSLCYWCPFFLPLSVSKLNTIFENEWNNFDDKWSTWQEHETINFGGQKVRHLGHARLKVDLKAWWRLHSRPACVEWLFRLGVLPLSQFLTSICLRYFLFGCIFNYCDLLL